MIRKNIALYYKDVLMPGGYYHNLPETLKMIDAYYNSHFLSGQYDDVGMRKPFLNIVKSPCDNATKFIDLDVKNIDMVGVNGTPHEVVWYMERDFKQWLRDNEFGVTLNEMAFDIPKYGHIVLKKIQDHWIVVDLHTLRCDPSSKGYTKGHFLYEHEVMTRHEVDEMKEWDKEKVAELYARGSEVYYDIYDCYDLNEEDGKKWIHTVKADVYTIQGNKGFDRRPEVQNLEGKTEYVPELVLFEEELDDLPYKEHKFENVRGRALGFGFVEYLKEEQIKINTIMYYEAKGEQWKATQVYQTRDQEFDGKNILSDVENGQILKTMQEITPVAKDNSDLSVYNNARNAWMQSKTQKVFDTDIARGDNLPANTPLGLGQLQAGMVASYFEQKRENFGLFIKSILLNNIIPQFKKKNKKEHSLSITNVDKDFDVFVRMQADTLLNEAIAERYKNGGGVTLLEIDELRQQITEEISTRSKIEVTIPDDCYKEAKIKIDFIITGESVNPATKVQTLMQALQMVASNPGILTNPATREVFFQAIETAGGSPVEMGLISRLSAQQQPPQNIPQQAQIQAPNQTQQVAGATVPQGTI